MNFNNRILFSIGSSLTGILAVLYMSTGVNPVLGVLCLLNSLFLLFRKEKFPENPTLSLLNIILFGIGFVCTVLQLGICSYQDAFRSALLTGYALILSVLFKGVKTEIQP